MGRGHLLSCRDASGLRLPPCLAVSDLWLLCSPVASLASRSWPASLDGDMMATLRKPRVFPWDWQPQQSPLKVPAASLAALYPAASLHPTEVLPLAFVEDSGWLICYWPRSNTCLYNQPPLPPPGLFLADPHLVPVCRRVLHPKSCLSCDVRALPIFYLLQMGRVDEGRVVFYL